MTKTLLLICLLLLSKAALAITPFIIADIKVKGIERLEAGTVFNYLPLKVGDELNDEEARLSIKELFATGFFKDVALEQEGATLVVKVVERPSISALTISGNKALDSAALERALEQAGLVEGRIFNSARLDQVVQEIKDTYLSLGRYSASVETSSEELERNRVAVMLTINEGRVATIKKVNIIGADKIAEKKLIKEMSLRDRRGWRLFSKRNQYSKQKLEADIEAIRSYYLDRGFHDFKIVSSGVDISPNKQNIFINISLDEGDRYVFGETAFEIAAGAAAGLDKLITIERGAPFSRKAVNASRQAIAAQYADDGYAFVEVRPIYETDREANVVTTVFVIEPKQRVYVRKVEIIGNLHTRDPVIRRELRQFEGAWYSAGAVSRSKSRLRRLGYFDEVTIETPQVPGAADQVDVLVSVRERNTGAISFSLGYSDSDGTLIGGAYSQRNLLGSGKELNVALNSSDAARTAEILYVNPYHTEDGISRGLRLSTRRVDTEEVNSAEYVVNTAAAGVNYKIPIAETNSLNFGLEAEQIQLDTTASTPVEIQAIIDAKPKGENWVLTLGVSKDARNDFFFPTAGASGAASLELAPPGSEHAYYKLNLRGAYYVPLPGNLSVKGSMSIGYGGSFDNPKQEDADGGLPFFKHYFAGGSNSVRGFQGRSLGPKSSTWANQRAAADGTTACLATEQAGVACDTNGDGIVDSDTGVGDNNTDGTPYAATTIVADPIGGDKRLLVNAELLFPPFGGEENNDKRMALFVDGGQVFGEGEPVDFGDLRYSVGLAFNWLSPIGPFSISYAVPLNEKSDDEVEKLQINLGAVFN